MYQWHAAEASEYGALSMPAATWGEVQAYVLCTRLLRQHIAGRPFF